MFISYNLLLGKKQYSGGSLFYEVLVAGTKISTFPIINTYFSVILAIFGFVVLIGGIFYAFFANVTGAILSIFGFVTGVTYLTDYRIRHFVMRNAPIFEKDIRPEDFTKAPQTLIPEYRLVRPADSSKAQLYPYVDLSHAAVNIRAENDLTRIQRLNLYQRWYEVCPHGFMHLEKLVDAEWRPIAVSIMLPLSQVGYQAITTKDTNNQTLIVDLSHNQIEAHLDNRHGILLIDTWIVDRAFKGKGHGKSPNQGGFANSLVLRHIATFWNQGIIGFPQVKFLVETDNKYLISVLRSLAFEIVGYSKIGEALYGVDKFMLQGIASQDYYRLISIIRKIKKVPVKIGTAMHPVNWEKTFKD